MFVGGYFTWTLIPHSKDHRQDYTVVYISLYQYTIDITLVQISNLNVEKKNYPKIHYAFKGNKIAI